MRDPNSLCMTIYMYDQPWESCHEAFLSHDCSSHAKSQCFLFLERFECMFACGKNNALSAGIWIKRHIAPCPVPQSWRRGGTRNLGRGPWCAWWRRWESPAPPLSGRNLTSWAGRVQGPLHFLGGCHCFSSKVTGSPETQVFESPWPKAVKARCLG